MSNRTTLLGRSLAVLALGAGLIGAPAVAASAVPSKTMMIAGLPSGCQAYANSIHWNSNTHVMSGVVHVKCRTLVNVKLNADNAQDGPCRGYAGDPDGSWTYSYSPSWFAGPDVSDSKFQYCGDTGSGTVPKSRPPAPGGGGGGSW